MASIFSFMVSFGAKPTMRSISLPCFVIIRHGIPDMLNFAAMSGCSSVLSFANFSFPV